MDEGSIGDMGNEEYENLYDPVDDVVSRLRLATVQDSAESIYELMTEAADQIELQRSLNSSLAASCASSESEVQRLRELADNFSNDQEQEIKRLRAQVQIAHSILGSEQMIWLLTGSEYEQDYLNQIRPSVQFYWEQYGNSFKPKEVRGE